MVYAVNLIGLLQFTVRTSAEMEDLVNTVIVYALAIKLIICVSLVGFCGESEGLWTTGF